MKKLFILGLVLLASTAFAQSFVVSPFVGYSYSDFEDVPYMESSTGTVSFGLAGGVVICDDFELGLEFVYPLGYVFQYRDVLETTLQNYLIGAYGKYYFRLHRFSPFFKIGASYFSGDGKFKRLEHYARVPNGDFEIEKTLGFSVGGGVLMQPGIFIKFDYNFVARDANYWPDDFIMNTWNLSVGYQFSFRK